jgi:hypothetical protein
MSHESISQRPPGGGARRAGAVATLVAAAIAALVAAALATATPAIADVKLASLNTLHLGQGSTAYQDNKQQILAQLFSTFDVIVLQEVMAQADLAQVTPGSHFFVTTPLQGPGTYKEAYAFLVRTGLAVASGAALITPVAGYSRPPAGILVGDAGVWTWIIDYHAVYGRTIGVRRAEVSRTRAVYQGFQATAVNGQTFARAVMAGDWNLGAQDRAFQDLARGGWPLAVQPMSRTSLKRNGGLSQPYDHFVWDTTALSLGNTQVIAVPNPPGSQLGWRQQVSDHLGISTLVPR